MAKKLGGKRTRTVETVVETPEETGEETLEEMDHEMAEIIEGEDRIDDEIEELIGGEDREGVVKLFRWNETGKRWKMVPSMSRQGFTRDLVAEAWGGGRYLMKVYKGKAYKGSKTFEIDEAVKPRPQPRMEGAAGGENAAPSWLAATLDKIGDAVKALADRPAPTPPAPPDPMAMIEKLAVTMRALTPPPLPAAPPAPGLKDQLDMIKSVVEVGTSIIDARGEGGGSGDAYMGAITKLSEPIIDLVKVRAQEEADRRRLTGPRRPALPAGRNPVTPPAAAPSAVAPSGGPMQAWMLEVQRWIPMMVKRATNDRSAEDTAFFICDELSEPTLTALAQLAALPDFQEQVTRVLPQELTAHPGWVAEFLSAVREYLFGDDEGPTAPEAGTPDTPPDGVFDLDMEAKRRLALLDDKPEEVIEPEPAPTG